jgi:hypothetical protein
MPLLLVLGLSSACAEGTLDDAPTDVPPADVADAPAEAALADAPAVDVPVAALDVAADVPVPTVDVPPSPDVPSSMDVPSELTDDVPLMMDAGVDVSVAVDVGVDAPVIPTDTGFGPGSTGYRVVRDDPSGRWVDACATPGHQTVLADVDDGSFRAALPFRFRFWGQPLLEGAAVLVSPNGYLTFQPGAPTPANGIIPNRLDGVDAVIAAQWRDLRTRSAGVCLAVLGNPGARQWVIQWSDARYYTSIFGHLNFEVVLSESIDTIDLNYGSMTLSEPATVALESWDGSRSSVPFTIPQPIVFSNTRARFVPQ